MGISGPDDPYHFEKDLNRATVEGTDDYRVVIFFIKKGARMLLHDHPNMCVFFKLQFGRLNYKSFDKVDDKFRYNKMSIDEHIDLVAKKDIIKAKLIHEGIITGP